jgi:FHS family glucose/mannose:H+ symporter-like MFS transporter
MKIEGAPQKRMVFWLSVGFALTGAGTTLLGCILPNLITAWRMNDARAGVLFAAQFAGSACGAILVGLDYFNSILRGYVLAIAGAIFIAFWANSSRWFLFFVFGLGLGLAMTATSMFVSRRFSERRGSTLLLLNAAWTMGAVICPGVAALWSERWAAERLFLALAVSLLIVFSLIMRPRAGLFSDNRVPAGVKHGPVPLGLIFMIALVAFLYVGVEVSVSGWMMSYVHRLTATGMASPAIAVSSFWISLVGGRALAPALLRRISEEELLTLSIAAAFISVCLVLLNRAPFAIVLGAAFSGLALGPIYPLCLSRVMALAHDSPNTKWVFATSGFGGALLPWMTGKLSAHHGSLRVGLEIPLFALGIMFVLQLLSAPRASTQSRAADSH